jgi:hypothetical protein
MCNNCGYARCDCLFFHVVKGAINGAMLVYGGGIALVFTVGMFIVGWQENGVLGILHATLVVAVVVGFFRFMGRLIGRFEQRRR